MSKKAYWYTIDSPTDMRDEYEADADAALDDVAEGIAAAHEQYFASEEPLGGTIYLFDAPTGGEPIASFCVDVDWSPNFYVTRAKK